MAWLSVNKDGTEVISPNEPTRWGFVKTKSKFGKKDENGERWTERIAQSWEIQDADLRYWSDHEILNMYDWIEYAIDLPKGTIEKLTGRILTWEGEPIELILDNK